MSNVKAVPPEYGSITPYIVTPQAAEAMDAYKAILGAVETMRMPMPDGSIGHAEIKLGDSMVMIASGDAEHPPTRCFLCYYVEDCDAVFERAKSAGWRVVKPLTDEFYGDRSGSLDDPFGQRWTIATHKEDVSPEEMERRMQS